jgi:excisionase family DNA binding protein
VKPQPLLVPVYPEAAQALGGLSRSKLYTEISAGRLKLVKIGRRAFIAQAELERYVAALSEASA